MTSYAGLPDKHRALVTEFRKALVRQMAENRIPLSFDVQFALLDRRAEKESERLAKIEDSPKRASNWRKVHHGWAEADKLSLVFAQARHALSEEEIADCVPAEIKPGGTYFSRYELEKNRLTHMTEYLVPKVIRDIGLY